MGLALKYNDEDETIPNKSLKPPKAGYLSPLKSQTVSDLYGITQDISAKSRALSLALQSFALFTKIFF